MFFSFPELEVLKCSTFCAVANGCVAAVALQRPVAGAGLAVIWLASGEKRFEPKRLSTKFAAHTINTFSC